MKRFLITAHAVFALVGVATTMLGPLLPLLAQRWHLGDRQSGALFLAQFFGGFIGAVVSTQLTRRVSLHWIARAGLLLIAAGYFAVASPSFLLAGCGIAIYGFGIGLATPSITAAVSEAAPQHRGALLNLLNFAWALGAITAPNLILAAWQRTSFNVPVMLACFAGVTAASAFVVPRIAASSLPEQRPESTLPASALRLVVACGILIFIYVGIENGMAGWLPTFATRLHGFGVQPRALLQDTFWTTFLLGRLCAPVALQLLSERLLLTLSICVAAAGTIGLLLAPGTLPLFLSVGVVGLGCAAIFPTAIAVLTQRLHGQSGSALGFMFASAGLGAAALPFCIGTVSAATGNLRIGMSSILVAECLLLVAHLVMSRFASAISGSAPEASVQAAGA